ncbi:MAG: phenylalanine--tRNA ligase subunit beta [Desulfitobacteriaceae bacterium]|nr:phenylalanine--tRNA ligase subunit beta [Desulfitobacteriaceae bacterium]MDD4401567.1 phenylalanine--tRNA ligase subunit beta [Desulfitobacteriaceae bacterium]
MKVSLNWLGQLVDIKESAENLAESLTCGGIEVGSVENLDKGLDRVFIGEIKELNRHPNANKLWVCDVNLGAEAVKIVCGAQNLRTGDRVPMARDGANLPNGMNIRTTELRGVVSEGMLCSAGELLLDDSLGDARSEGGILILSPDAPIGEKLAVFLGLNDSVLDLELYPNRPDCLAMVNVAREASLLSGEKLNLPDWVDYAKKPEVPLVQTPGIKIEEPELCWRYAGLIVEDVKIAPSPEWMQRRLWASGVRPINNIVDITNYCMLELGQPLHAFDHDKISGSIHVRCAYEGEKLTTLDGIERELETDMLLIADGKQALALAGVMGGLDSEITASTQRILVESAHFAGFSIRRTSRRLGLMSEASNRFEKGVNPYGIIMTLNRVSDLLVEMGAGRPVALVEETKYLPPLVKINLTAEHTSELLGVEVTKNEVCQVLTKLAFTYTDNGEKLSVEIPSYRQDLQIEVDLIEEVARAIGYDRIPTALPRGNQTQGSRTPEQEFRCQLRRSLTSLGMNEVVTYSFIHPKNDKEWGSLNQSITILNPLREDLKVMRTSLIPGLLDVVARNISRRNTDLCIFEIGNVYLASEQPLVNLPQELPRVAGAVIGKSKRHWLSPVITYDFFFVKGVMEQIAGEFDLTFNYEVPPDQDLLHPGRSADIYLNQVKVGFIGEIHPAKGKARDLKRTVIFELDLAPIMHNLQDGRQVQSIPRFPAMQRDFAVVVPLDTPAAAVMDKIRLLGGALLQQVDIFDVYTGKPIPDDRKSLGFALRYQSLERTLKDDEVNSLNSLILEGIQQEFAAEWRK